MIKYVGKYFFRYAFGYRYDYEINNYFNDPYRKAIQSLYLEGYDVEDEYIKLINDYQTIYSPLNREEIEYFFLNYLKKRKKQNPEFNETENIKWNRRMIFFNSSFLALHSKIYSLETDYKNQIKITAMHSEILTKEIQRINPIYNAVITRKLVKILEEKIIFKYKENFEVKNYYPNYDTLKKYKDSLIKLDFENKSEFIKKIEKEMTSLNLKITKKKEVEKVNPKIIYKSNNKITKIQKTLHSIRIYCHNIIHFDPNKEVEFHMDDSVFKDIISKGDEEPKKVQNKEYNGAEEKNISFLVDISKVVDYIAFNNIPNELLNKLSELKKEYDTQYNTIFSLLEKDEQYKKLNSYNYYEKSKEDILEINKAFKKFINKIEIPEFITGFKKREIENIIEYINSNKFELKELDINKIKCEKKEENYVSIINKEINKLDIYSRIKFNITLERNLSLLELKKDLEIALKTIKNMDDFYKRINELKIKIKEKLIEMKKEISFINDCLIVFDNKKIFKDIKVEEFVTYTKEIFEGTNIDLFSKEVNNIYLFIYFLKKGIYYEKAYKTVINSNDDYI